MVLFNLAREEDAADGHYEAVVTLERTGREITLSEPLQIPRCLCGWFVSRQGHKERYGEKKRKRKRKRSSIVERDRGKHTMEG